ncbi:MAG: DUF5808 domain-containing protein [Acidimicrobiales bacterium]
MADKDHSGEHDWLEPSHEDAGRNKKVLGVPYDLRRPSTSRFKSRLYNPEDTRLFPPKAFGVGWTINFYWLVHPSRYLANRRTRRH